MSKQDYNSHRERSSTNHSDIVSHFIYCLFCLALIQLLLYIGNISTLNFQLKAQCVEL